MTFKELNLDPQILEGLDIMQFKEPTPVQEQAIPAILAGKDLIAVAQTGTGKTAAYLLPMMHKIIQGERDQGINTLVIAPTRELALQIDQQVEGFGYFCPVTSIPIYGGGDGASFDQQKNALVQGTDIIIATPGKLISHLNLDYVDCSNLKHLVLDEADRMLDMGFHDDIMKIISYLPKQRQSLLFSATMPPKIRELSSKILHDPVHINIAISKPAEGVIQGAYLAYDNQKLALIKHLFKEKEIPSCIIFASRKTKVKEIEKALKQLNMQAKAIHSDLDQAEREEVLNAFKHKKIKILVATDIVSRGIDIKDIALILNYDVPQDAEDYIHRIGRTARAESTGIGLTFINQDDQHRFQRIEQLIEKEINKLPNPPDIGEGPAYNPNKRSGGHFRGRGQGGGKRGGGGNRNFRGKGKGGGKGGNRKGRSSSGRSKS